jgi:hypothetical protein
MTDNIFVPATDILQHIERSMLATSPLLDDYRRSYTALGNGTAKPVRKRRERKPSVASLIKRAEKAGKTVTAITTAEGVTLTFGGADKPADNGNPWDVAAAELRKRMQ